MMLYTSMKLEDVDRLEQVFAYRTEAGWLVPSWLYELRMWVLRLDAIEAEKQARLAGEKPSPGPWADYLQGRVVLPR